MYLRNYTETGFPVAETTCTAHPGNSREKRTPRTDRPEHAPGNPVRGVGLDAQWSLLETGTGTPGSANPASTTGALADPAGMRKTIHGNISSLAAAIVVPRRQRKGMECCR